MRITPILLVLVATLGLSACAQDTATSYPISGQQCTEGDPVLGLDPVDCAPAGAI